MDIFNFLAKSNGIKLHEHTEHVVTAASNLIERLPLSKEERQVWQKIIRDCAVLHDLGKIHPDFQKNLLNNKTLVSIRHEVVSLWIISTFLNLSDEYLFAIATHHKGVTDTSFGETSKRLSAGISNDLVKHIKKARLLLQQMPDFLEKWNQHFDTTVIE
jgi:CRISPR-associated endonuclease/helicase Cas3